MGKKIGILISITIFFLILLLFRFVLFIGYIPSESMEPTMKVGEVFIASRFFYRIEKGDIIVFVREGKLLVKRVAGCPGDIVVIGDHSWIVPNNGYFLLGDNLEVSFDSRYWEDPFIGMDQIIAKCFSQ